MLLLESFPVTPEGWKNFGRARTVVKCEFCKRSQFKRKNYCIACHRLLTLPTNENLPVRVKLLPVCVAQDMELQLALKRVREGLY